MMEIGNGFLMTHDAVPIRRNVTFINGDNLLTALGDVFFFEGGRNVVHGRHPSMPFGGDGGRIEIVNVARFDPAMLAEGIVYAIFVVAVSGGVVAHVSSEFEGVVSVLDEWFKV
jgi:hypothetical protein